MTLAKGVLLTLICSVVLIPCIAALPAINIDANAVISSSFYTYIRAGLYFLPIGTVTTIFGIQIALWTFRIIVAVVRAVWDLLPFV